MDCAPSLNVYAAEVEAGLAFARRTGGEQTGQWLENYRWLADVLRGERSATAGEVVPIDSYAGNPLAVPTRIPRARSPPPCSAIRLVWRATPRRRCRCCRLSRRARIRWRR